MPHNRGVRIRAVSVFEGVIYNSHVMDWSHPERPTLEVDAVLRPGDADATSGPLLLPVAEFIVMVGGVDVARPILLDLAARGRVTTHQGVDHLVFPTWTTVDESGT